MSPSKAPFNVTKLIVTIPRYYLGLMITTDIVIEVDIQKSLTEFNVNYFSLPRYSSVAITAFSIPNQFQLSSFHYLSISRLGCPPFLPGWHHIHQCLWDAFIN